MKPNFIFNASYVDNQDEVSVVYGLHDPLVFSRLVINESRVVERLTWHERDHRWVGFWFEPEDKCDKYSNCDANSDCDPYSSSGF